MRQKNLQTVLSALVGECGHESVARVLEQLRPPPVKPQKDGKKTAKSRGKKTAVAVVDSLDLPEGEKKRVLKRLAERYESKTFMPNVNHVRAFLDKLGADVSGIKSRQQVTVKVFNCLANMPEDEVREIESGGYFDPPKSADAIADAIHSFGRQQRQGAHL